MSNTTIDYNQQALDFLKITKTVLSFSYDGFKKYFTDDKQERNVFSWQLSRLNKTIKGKFGSSINDSCKETPILNSSERIEIYVGLSVIDPNQAAFASKPKKLYASLVIKTDCKILNGIKHGIIDATDIVPIAEATKVYNDFISAFKKRKQPGGIMSSLDSFIGYGVKRINDKLLELENKTILLDKADVILSPSEYDLLSCLTKYDPGTFENFCADFGYDADSRKAEKTYKNVLKEWRDVSSVFDDSELELLRSID
jgi:hypothetical protein